MPASGLSRGEVAEVVRRYGFFLRRRCRVLLRDDALADDALQEVYVKLLRAGGPLREAEHPMRWLYRVVDRASFDLLRRGKRIRGAAPLDAVDEIAHPGVSPELRRTVLELLASLDHEEQEIAVMAFVDGMTQKEIADELGYSRVTVNKRVAAIRARAGAAEAEEVAQ